MAKYITLDNLSTFLEQLKTKYVASETTYGGIKIGFQDSENDRNYPVELDDNGKAFVNVPWGDTQQAGVDTLGGIKLFTAKRNTDLTNSMTMGQTTSNRYYGVELDANGKAFVNVPWNAYSTASTTNLGLVKMRQGSALSMDGDSLSLNIGTGLNIVTDSSNTVGSLILDINEGCGLKYQSQTGKLYLDTDRYYLGTSTTNSLTWGMPINMTTIVNLNNYVEAGVYRFDGERISADADDNFPITNGNPGHTIQGTLMVYNSSLANGSGANDDACVTQVFTLSNRTAHEGKMYIRTGVGKNIYSLNWENWKEFQTNMIYSTPITSDELNTEPFINNGMYSGVIQDNPYNATTFVLITVNNWAIASRIGQPVRCTQLIYNVDLFGNSQVQKRTGVRDGNTSTWSWTAWSSLGEGSSSTTTIRTVNPSGESIGVGTLQIGEVCYCNTNNETKSIVISGFATPVANTVNTYGLTIKVPSNSTLVVTYPENVTIKWANGIVPFFTSQEVVEIIFTTYDNGQTFNGTWTKYF